ncbi:F-box-like domain-containing protein [Pochonia chlamydosporia 170]|uniref:F-box-like domain-containing protein n=1 Tax=Pochonia chlamydosporia 170 TaxID=1380566 RepID=A0A179FGX2_METCM|nr:F-box-like domain-containing protein [Pochonia chlamydosporia 170]OAQ64776.2 F-box-like domain-containing protein [Pochonia chlamydosporia 170]
MDDWDDWDTCCAICGVPWGPFMAEIENAMRSSAKSSPFSTTNLGEGDTHWLHQNNSMGLWSDSSHGSRSESTSDCLLVITNIAWSVFYTRKFFSGEFGSVTLMELDLDGEEPEYISDIYYGQGMVTYPSFTRQGLVVFPFHDACFDLLSRVITSQTESPLDEEILYAAFVELGNGDKPWILNLDYGDPAPKGNPKTFGLYPQDPTVHHDWWKNYGHEELLKNHAKKVDLSAYLVPRPTLHAETSKTHHALHDPFYGLPVEIREHILELLDFRGLLAVRAASYAMRSVVPSNALWRKSFSANMPWLYEMEDLLRRGNEHQSFDLCLSMEELERRSSYHDGIDGLDLILANRRRVWSR